MVNDLLYHVDVTIVVMEKKNKMPELILNSTFALSHPLTYQMQDLQPAWYRLLQIEMEEFPASTAIDHIKQKWQGPGSLQVTPFGNKLKKRGDAVTPPIEKWAEVTWNTAFFPLPWVCLAALKEEQGKKALCILTVLHPSMCGIQTF